MKISCVWEHNGNDTLLYAENLPGAFCRGKNLNEAMEKMPAEAVAYLRWRGEDVPDAFEIAIVQEKPSNLKICDADSDVLFESEKAALEMREYLALKALALQSAQDFLRLYESVGDKNKSALAPRDTFYGPVPRTAQEMYEHTRQVNEYYFAEIGVQADNEGTIVECRRRGFAALEQQAEFLNAGAVEGSYGEMWSLRKVIRRFVWHDRIHARALYRMAKKTFGAAQDVFHFEG